MGLFLLFPFIFLWILLPSCSPTKVTTYFNSLPKDTILQGFITDSFETRIQKKDVISITVSSLNKDLDDAFNNATTGTNETIAMGVGKPPIGYTVDEKGNILIHLLGNVHVEGLTRKELQQKLQQDLIPYLKEPIVGIQYLNHKVTVIGSVEKPQVLNMPGEQMPLLDVIVSSGDLTQEARKNDIMIIRENGTEKQIKHVNLEDHSLFTSPWYYVKSNDIVYVMQDKAKLDKEESRKTRQTALTLIFSAVSLLIIILNTFVK